MDYEKPSRQSTEPKPPDKPSQPEKSTMNTTDATANAISDDAAEYAKAAAMRKTQ